jgi:hypothetical protein
MKRTSKEIDELIKSLAAQGSLERYEVIKNLKPGEFESNVNSNFNPEGYLSFFGAALPTLGRLAEISGILPRGNTLTVVMKIVGWVSMVIDAASSAAGSPPKKMDKLVHLGKGDMV